MVAIEAIGRRLRELHDSRFTTMCGEFFDGRRLRICPYGVIAVQNYARGVWSVECVVGVLFLFLAQVQRAGCLAAESIGIKSIFEIRPRIFCISLEQRGVPGTWGFVRLD